MGVIPLTTEGPNPTVVTSQRAFEEAGGRQGHAVLISNHDPDQFCPSKNSNVSYDLRVGKEYRDHRKRDKKTIPEDGVITLEPGAAFMMLTEEYVHLPCSMFGIIAPKVTLLEQGISNTFSKVDPGYYGNLEVTVFNLGKTTVTLSPRQPFCALTLIEVGPNARPYEKGPKIIPGRLAVQPRQSLQAWLKAHDILVTIGLIVSTFLLFLIEMIRLLKR